MALRKQWIARLDMKEVVVLRANDATVIEEHFAVPGPVAAAHVDHWFPSWHRDRRRLAREVARVPAGRCTWRRARKASHIETRWLKERVQAAFRRKDLLVAPAARHGAFRPLLPMLTDNVAELPKTRGVYIAYRFDVPFYIGDCACAICAPA